MSPPLQGSGRGRDLEKLSWQLQKEKDASGEQNAAPNKPIARLTCDLGSVAVGVSFLT